MVTNASAKGGWLPEELSGTARPIFRGYRATLGPSLG